MIEIVARLLLAGALGGAALAKLSAPRSSEAALATFGFSAGPLRRAAWAGLVAAELALAAGVVAGSDEAAYGAAALMAMFAALMGSALMRGRAGAPCACFGSRSRVSALAVARNLALAAGFAALPSLPAGSLSTDQWLGLGLAVALIACAALAVVVLALAREVGMLRLQAGGRGALEIPGEGPELGTAAPELSARLPRPDHELALAVFTSEGCHLCRSLEPAVASLESEPGLAVGRFDEVADAELWRSLEVPGSPYAVALGPGGTVLAKGTFNDLAQLESVVATAERRRAEGAARTAGSVGIA
ncbi:MAG: MauE/DoxX family redox-associated membrane protein [Solirubrobacterales bacterium]